MPRALLGRDVLDERAVAPDQIVRRDPEALDLLEVRVRVGIEAAHEEIIYIRTAILAGGKRDVVDHEERDLLALGAVVVVGGVADFGQGITP